MDFLSDFAIDSEFLKLLSRREEVELPVAALELARDHCPGVDFQPTLRWISDRAFALRKPLAHCRNEAEEVATLVQTLAKDQGLHGSEAVYEQPESSFLHCVIERKTGLPIALSVVYMAVAAKAGLTLHGIAVANHFLTRYDTSDKPLFIDPFHDGNVLSWRECLTWVRKTAKLPAGRAKAALEPVGARLIIQRMLNNLKALYAKQENWVACCKVQHRLLALSPASYAERRDWAMISLKAGRSAPAIDMLAACLPTAPDDEREALSAHLAEAKRQHAKWN
ncbi:MAG: SirB1 family protein [Planctomycetaceae bacterium]